MFACTVSPLEFLFNLSLFVRKFLRNGSNCLQRVYLPKKTPHTVPFKYRTTNIASVFYRLFIKILRDYHWASWLPRNFAVKSTWVWKILILECNAHLYVVFFDFQKEFNRASHDELLRKIRIAGLHPRIRVTEESLKDRFSCLEKNNRLFNAISAPSGIHQGGVLSPTLINIHVNDLLEQSGATSL